MISRSRAPLPKDDGCERTTERRGDPGDKANFTPAQPACVHAALGTVQPGGMWPSARTDDGQVATAGSATL